MKFSKRTEWELSSNRITQILEDLKKSGQNILDLTESNPTRCGFLYPPEIIASFSSEKNLEYAPSPQGLFGAREAVCAYYAQKGLHVDPEQVFLTASTSESYSFLFRLLAEPGEAVAFPQPSYPLFQFLVDLNDLRMETYRLLYRNRWQVDLENLRAALNPQVRAMVLVNPNNPTGSSFSVAERQEIQEICRDRELPLICDEVFLDYPFEEKTHIQSFLHGPEALAFILGGVSKTLALPQMKVGWIVLGGPKELVLRARARLEVIADTYLSVNTPAQNALPLWIKKQGMIQEQILNRIRKNRQKIFETIPSDGQCLNADGGWYAVIRLPQGCREEAVVKELLEKHSVFVHPGYFFDFAEESFVVVSLLPQPEIFEEGLARLWRQI